MNFYDIPVDVNGEITLDFQHQQIQNAKVVSDCVKYRLQNKRIRDNHKWDQRFLSTARLISTWSRDPSTKTGAVIVSPNKSIVSLGFNGFARGTKDHEKLYLDRDYKISRIIHCEINAILFADRQRLVGATLYTTPFLSCSNCAEIVVQSGITRCVAPPLPDNLIERWQRSCETAQKTFAEAGVAVDFVTPTGE